MAINKTLSRNFPEYHFLMLKIHKKTRMKYLCKSSSEKIFTQGIEYLFQYKGSGKRWLNHLRKNGNDVETIILYGTSCKEDLKRVGLQFSKSWDVVNREDFANLTEESGDGGKTWQGREHKSWKLNEQAKKNIGKGSKKKFQEGFRLPQWEHMKGDNNPAVRGYYITPWGKYTSPYWAYIAAKELKKNNILVITDSNTIFKYCKEPDTVISKYGRAPKEWKNKTAREIGFDYILKEKINEK